jgi:glycosyltransferase 2 family protein
LILPAWFLGFSVVHQGLAQLFVVPKAVVGGKECGVATPSLKPKLLKLGLVSACSALLLAVVLARLDLARLGAALARVQPLWLLAAGGAFLGGLLCGALRWSAALRAGGVSVRSGPLVRACLASHLFNVILLSPALGDVAKSALFARWHGARASTIYATTLLDRVFSVGGTVLFVGLVLALFLRGPALDELQFRGRENSLWLWLLPLLLAAVLAAVWKTSPRLCELARTVLGRLRESLQQLRQRPALAAGGCLAGLAGQACNTAILPLCLAAVSSVAVPWNAVMWTFPLIAVAAVLPVTIGGAGVREGAALLLLSRHGIPAEDIVAAGLLTLGVYLGWALAGAAVGWREELAFLRGQEQPA